MLLLLWRKWTGRGSAALAEEAELGPDEAIEAIRNGDAALRNEWIRQYRPFIAKTASRFAKRYIDPNRDDEFSVALSAFDEAIDGYSAEAGGSFLGFAAQVMNRRLIDYARREQRHSSVLPYSSLQGDREEESSALSAVEAREAITAYERDRAADDRREEIAALTEELRPYGIGFADLAEQSPKHQDSRNTLLEIGARLARNPVLFGLLVSKRQLPLKELCELESVSRKTLERNRKYLIAVTVIAGGPFPLLQEYIRPSQPEKKEETP